MSARNADIARRGFEAVARGDIDALSDLLDPGVRWHAGDPCARFACRSRDEVLAYMHRARERGRPLPQLVDVVDAGERVVVLLRPADHGGLRANVTTFRNGRVIEMVAYEDAEEALATIRR